MKIKPDVSFCFELSCRDCVKSDSRLADLTSVDGSQGTSWSFRCVPDLSKTSNAIVNLSINTSNRRKIDIFLYMTLKPMCQSPRFQFTPGFIGWAQRHLCVVLTSSSLPNMPLFSRWLWHHKDLLSTSSVSAPLCQLLCLNSQGIECWWLGTLRTNKS